MTSSAEILQRATPPALLTDRSKADRVSKGGAALLRRPRWFVIRQEPAPVPKLAAVALLFPRGRLGGGRYIRRLISPCCTTTGPCGQRSILRSCSLTSALSLARRQPGAFCRSPLGRSKPAPSSPVCATGLVWSMQQGVGPRPSRSSRVLTTSTFAQRYRRAQLRGLKDIWTRPPEFGNHTGAYIHQAS